MADTEAVLLRRFVRTGDAEAFAEIIRRYAGLVYGTAVRILADMDRAADVAQETFLQLTKDAGSVTGSLAGWLHRVATHKAIDQMRRDTSRRHREMAYVAKQPGEAAPWKHLSRHVDEGLDELDTEIKDILVAHFLQGQTTRQIARVRGISQATVSRRLDAGVAQLRGMLRKRGIIVAAGTLSAMLGENAVQAAPMALMAELGKMALVGGQAAVVSATATAGASAAQTVAGGVLAAVKGKAAAVAVVAVIGAGSYVTYQHATKPSSESIVITRSPSQRASRPVPRSASSSPGGPVSSPASSDAARRWDELMRAALNQPSAARSDAPTPQAGGAQQQEAAAPEEDPGVAPATPAGGMMGGFAAANDGPAEPNEQVPGQGAVGAMGGASYSYGATPPASPNIPDPNAPGGP